MPATLQDSTRTLSLNTGAQIPQVGLGTWQSKDNDAYKSVLAALTDGYRHIDTAAIYRNEDQVGQAIRDSGVPREKIFVTTKLWCSQHHEPAKALDQSLRRLGLDYVDLYLMHWPVRLDPDYIKDGNILSVPTKQDGSRAVDITNWNFIKTWELMQELPKTGKAKAVGVSNFSINNLKDLLASKGNKLTPAANQVEIHPLLPQNELIDFCRGKGIMIEGYSPLGSTDAPLLKEPVILEIAKKTTSNLPTLSLAGMLKGAMLFCPNLSILRESKRTGKYSPYPTRTSRLLTVYQRQKGRKELFIQTGLLSKHSNEYADEFLKRYMMLG
ncbi:Gcy1p [Saccharomyces cerevisiae x Saccharomyces kudriavzevii VIN7]|uniref:Gcy1p n=1 Tax=Saccharomyces cerevisiae x Saccharomyces kudriavzevii (strain VIN7) TaxID=1095631 RepID=H0H156_SACCK|nr:Gcy1p [Saccharomyces cerevisiae x Saccharomyces kudriavzevii VIN7]